MTQLGGYPLFLSSADIQLGRGESIYDTANVLSRYLDGIMIRTYAHSDVLDLAKYSTIPIINGLTDLLHPCQVLADLQTTYEHKGKLEGLKLAYLGDGNNMAHSLLYGCAKVGMDVAVATPDGYKCDAQVVENAKADAKQSGSGGLDYNRPGGGNCKRRCSVHRYVGEHGPRGGKGGAAQNFHAVSGGRKAVCKGEAGRNLYALPAGVPRL